MMDELLADFLTETNEGLAEADRALLALEQRPGDKATLAVLFRALHTIKGSSGFLPLPRLGRIAHAAEDVLVGVRSGQIGADATVVSALLAALDHIKWIVGSIARTHHEPAGDDASLIAELAALAQGQAGPAMATPGAGGAEAAANAPMAQTIRVGVTVLESLMRLVGELVLTRNQLLQIARLQDDRRFDAPLERLARLTSTLQDGVMKTRMQPIGHLHTTLTRLVRGLGQELGKSIELVMTGAETELDRQVLDLMRDPLIHMVRNSADHGLEDAATRGAAGKRATGRISIHAYHEGGHVVIELGDDGAGLQTDRIRAQVLARGLTTEAKLAAMTDADIQRFILQPGFTTSSRVSAVSGRGVGMDVVKANIERIGGTIAARSTPGAGTVFTIRIPLTLAIIAAFIVESRGQRFALPQLCVVELLRLGMRGDGAAEPDGPVADMVDGTPVLRLRDRVLPLLDLAQALALDEAAPAMAGSPIVVVLSVDGNSFGLVVDRVFDTEEIVVKPMAALLRHITMFSGKTILGDGTVMMIIEPNGLARALGPSAPAPPPRPALAAAEGESSREPTSLLLFRAAAGLPIVAVPLALVARIEMIASEAMETSSGRRVTQYRGTLLPLLAMEPMSEVAGSVPVLVFTDRDRSMGLIVHEVVDVVSERLVIKLPAAWPELLGTAVIAGRATDVINASYWLVQAWQDWFQQKPHSALTRKRVLVVEDSAFFRQLLVPMLTADGYDVTAVESATRALALRQSEASFDAIISDVEMPGMDGLEFARTVRTGGPWSATPLLALSGRGSEADAARGRAAGFSDYVAKLDREMLLSTLHRCVSAPELQAL